jgi:hypothetical protein
MVIMEVKKYLSVGVASGVMGVVAERNFSTISKFFTHDVAPAIIGCARNVSDYLLDFSPPSDNVDLILRYGAKAATIVAAAATYYKIKGGREI